MHILHYDSHSFRLLWRKAIFLMSSICMYSWMSIVILLSRFLLFQAELEDTILALLSSATGSLLDNVALINTLDASKTTWEEVNQSLKVR
jgi:hypothetical protein